MKIIVDSREKWTQPGSTDTHISRHLDKAGVPWVVQKLDVGDYMLEGGNVSVDRKKSLDELAHNLLNRSDSHRFWREVRRAKEQKITLIVLCECGGKVKEISDLVGWKSKYSGVTGRRLMDEVFRCHISYGVGFLFCDRRSTGRRILEILQGGEE